MQRLFLSLGITLLFVGGEALAGVFANSLALLTDAAHNFTDALALALTAWALWITSRPAGPRRTYGYHRAGILVALFNAVTLIIIALGIFYEAYRRFVAPVEVQSGVMIWVGLAAVVVNLVTALLVRRGSEHDLNLRSAFLHLMGDVLSTVGAVIAGIIIRFTGMNWLDPLVSLLIGGMILWAASGILRQSLRILMEATPEGVDMTALQQDLLAVPGVHGVHDLHVWSLNSSLRCLTAHLLTDDISIHSAASIREQVRSMLQQRHGIGHATLQLECEPCGRGDLFCNDAGGSTGAEPQ